MIVAQGQSRKQIVVVFLLLAGLEVCPSIQALALDPSKAINQYAVKLWSLNNGLPSSAVNTVIQTQDGYLWLATTAGLFRFDGAQFVRISTDPANEETRETITALCETNDRSLWVGTANNWMCRIHDGKIIRYTERDGLNSRNVYSLFESRTGVMWIGTSYGLYTYQNNIFTPVHIDPKFITGIAEDALGRIWVGTYEGIRIITDPNLLSAQPMTDVKNISGITAIYADRNGGMWLGTFSGAAYWKNGIVKRYAVADGLSDFSITSLAEDRNGNIWVGTSTGGINRFANGRWTSLKSANDISTNTVLSVMEDREGSLWVSTENGLNQYRDVNVTTFTTHQGLAGDNISSVIELPDKSVYFLSQKANRITWMKNGVCQTYPVAVGPAYLARDGSLWIANWGRITKLKDGRITIYDQRNGVPLKWISAITGDKTSIIFFADHGGLFRLTDNGVVPYALQGDARYPSRDYVVCFCSQQNDVLWIGSTSGLFKISNGILTRYTVADSLAGNWVSSIYDDLQGSLWISSPQVGLTHYKNGKFIPYNTRVGLFNDEISCVVGDALGDLWLSSPRGIGHIRHQDITAYEQGRISSVRTEVYTTADGMKTEACFGDWQPSGWKADDGDIWFATEKGAVKIDRQAFRHNDVAPTVLIENVVVDGQTVPTDREVTFAPGKGKFAFHYTALSYLVPERVHFKYKLEGYDREFIAAGTRRTAYYTNLKPGTYKFRVMACNNDGVWNEAVSEFTFELEPHFYETFWFYALVVVAIVFVIIVAYRIRVVHILSREKELQARIHEAMANIKTLSGLIPICAHCHKIRSDDGYWNQLERYIQEHSETVVAHDLCPECAAVQSSLPQTITPTETDNA
ncbi:MAG TPA: two-component regulator propeller domain-containing protein [Bacteroidota bacterium]|nr:two-component regulator propeller domain-containing protein [Bacteroidota bacterium]